MDKRKRQRTAGTPIQPGNGHHCKITERESLILTMSDSNMKSGLLSSRLTVSEIASRLDIGRLAVYALLERGLIPGIRLGRRWIITRHAYEQWERTCGMYARAGLRSTTEVKVLN